MSEIRPFAFVLMPFDKEFDDLYQLGIKSTAESLGIVAERVDEQNFSESILDRIYRQIRNADFIIAEMTGQNPNVFYEVGYAHAHEKLCVLITRNAADIPFDLKHHTHIVHGGSISALKEQLAEKFEWIKKEIVEKKERSISIVIENDDEGLLKKSEFSHHGSFEMSIQISNGSDRRTPAMDAIYVTTSQDWKLLENDKECPSSNDTSNKKLKKHLFKPAVQNLSPGAFSKSTIQFQRMLWNKFSGDEPQEEYRVKGIVSVEVHTAGGVFKDEFALDVLFNEFPF